MEILGIGPMELVLILIIALLVFGPNRLPEIGAKLGKSMREMRRATRDFSREIEQARQTVAEPLQEMREPVAELTTPFQDVKDAAQALAHPGEALRQSVMRELLAPESVAVEESTTPAVPAEAVPPSQEPQAAAEPVEAESFSPASGAAEPQPEAFTDPQPEAAADAMPDTEEE